MPVCCIPGCVSGDRYPEFPLHTVPLEPNRRRQFREILLRLRYNQEFKARLEGHQAVHVCRKHFKPTDIIKGNLN